MVPYGFFDALIEKPKSLWKTFFIIYLYSASWG